MPPYKNKSLFLWIIYTHTDSYTWNELIEKLQKIYSENQTDEFTGQN